MIFSRIIYWRERHAVNSSNAPVGISEYELSELMPEDFKGTLPSIEKIERGLTQSEKSPTSLSVSVGGGYDKLYSVGVQAPTELNAPRGCARIRTGICLLKQTRIRRARLASES